MKQDKPKSILLVEDDVDASKMLCAILSVRFPQVLIYSASNGKAGLDSIIKYLPDVVITDISMPEMNGTRMISKIPAIKPDTRVIVATAYSDWNNPDMFALTGVDCEFVSKPIDFEVLFASVERGVF